MDLDISRKEEVLLTASKDGKSLVLDPDTFDIIETLHPQNPTRNINSCRISPLMSLDDENKVKFHAFIAGGQESREVTTTHAKKGGFELLIYNMMFGNELGAIQGHFGPINALAVTSDGYCVASGAEESSVRVHRLDYDEYNDGFLIIFKNADELVIQDLKQYFYENNSIKFNVNIFGSPFYYLQDEKIKNKDTQRNVKALLFLHTFKYNYANILNVNFVTNWLSISYNLIFVNF